MATAIQRISRLGVAAACHAWLVTSLSVAMPGCGADFCASPAVADRKNVGEKTVAANTAGDVAARQIAAADFSVAAPSSDQPVAAAMKIRPESAAAGSTVEILVYARIAPMHYLHAAGDAGEPFTSVAMEIALPKEVEPIGDWQLPTPEIGKGNAPVYRDAILLRRWLKILSGTPPQTLQIAGELRYQACTEELCWPPRKIALSVPLVIRSKPPR
ncbi:MAG TPA: hypothetical protein VGG30_08935 [Pirellulales bacterium]|jgi:hypothetical protein